MSDVDLDDRAVCEWYKLATAEGTSMENPNPRLKNCKDRCDGYGLVDDRIVCQIYYTLEQRGMV